MIRFDCDYMAGAHPKVLDAIVKYNFEQTSGYGSDRFCRSAEKMILDACGIDPANGKVFFLVGGTQTNSSVIDGLLRRTQGVIAADTGHINVHEAGAIELSGHKVISLPGHDGKLCACDVEKFIKDFRADETCAHMVAPGAVYISFPTELGTLYSRDELSALHNVCLQAGIPLFLDGARLGYGLAASEDLTLKDIADLTDIFYIGGTKMGLLFGEALVCKNPGLMPDFFTLMKARGAVLAKGRLLGQQFEALFTDGLYLEIGREAVRLALKLRKILESHGYVPFIDSRTNQQFFTLPNELIDRLLPEISFEYWGPRGETDSKVRFVTSWETRESDIQALEKAL